MYCVAETTLVLDKLSVKYLELNNKLLRLPFLDFRKGHVFKFELKSTKLYKCVNSCCTGQVLNSISSLQYISR